MPSSLSRSSSLGPSSPGQKMSYPSWPATCCCGTPPAPACRASGAVALPESTQKREWKKKASKGGGRPRTCGLGERDEVRVRGVLKHQALVVLFFRVGRHHLVGVLRCNAAGRRGEKAVFNRFGILKAGNAGRTEGEEVVEARGAVCVGVPTALPHRMGCTWCRRRCCWCSSIPRGPAGWAWCPYSCPLCPPHGSFPSSCPAQLANQRVLRTSPGHTTNNRGAKLTGLPNQEGGGEHNEHVTGAEDPRDRDQLLARSGEQGFLHGYFGNRPAVEGVSLCT